MNNLAFLISILLLGGCIALTSTIGARDFPIVIATHIERLPHDIDGFRGDDDRFAESIYAELNADHNLYRHYRSQTGETLDLYIGYYGTAKGGRSAHNPMSCLPGAGWVIIRDQYVDLQMSGTHSSQIRNIVASRDGRFVNLFHWYQTNRTEVAANGIIQNLLRFKNRLLHNRDDGAYVQVTVFSDQGGLINAGRSGLGFASTISQLLPDYWPEERSRG